MGYCVSEIYTCKQNDNHYCCRNNAHEVLEICNRHHNLLFINGTNATICWLVDCTEFTIGHGCRNHLSSLGTSDGGYWIDLGLQVVVTAQEKWQQDSQSKSLLVAKILYKKEIDNLLL
jgi:hypothetical protein